MPEPVTPTPIAERVGYLARFNGVVDYIDAHLAEPLDLHTLAAVAHFSPWHFHRLFRAIVGETLAARVRRCRLEAAAGMLLASPQTLVHAVALDAGFGSAEVFTRTFKSHFGVSPTAWRRGAHRSWADTRRTQMREIHRTLHEPHQAGSRSKERIGDMRVELKTLPTMRVAYMRHVGPYGDPRIGRMWERFARWASHNGWRDGKRLFAGVSHDSADIAMPDKCRYDACVEVDSSFKPRHDVGSQEIRGGLHGCVRYVGVVDDIYEAWLRLYSEWLPESGYQPDDRPCIEVYGPNVVVDSQTGEFACDLCLPVRPL
jgi:AraC family transcriptional regulator